jgi:hypothetical protein
LRGRCSRKGQYKGQRQTQIDCAFCCGHGRPPPHVGSDRSLSDETASRHGSWVMGHGMVGAWRPSCSDAMKCCKTCTAGWSLPG